MYGMKLKTNLIKIRCSTVFSKGTCIITISNNSANALDKLLHWSRLPVTGFSTGT